MKLAHKIVLLVVTAFLAVLVTLGYFESRRAVREHRKLVASELAITGRALRGPLADVVKFEGEPRAVQLLASADAEIVGSDLRWAPLSKLDLPVPVDREKLDRGETVTAEVDGEPGRLYVLVPVPGANAAIEVSQSLEAERSVVLEIVKQRLLLALLAVLAAAALATAGGVRLIGRRMAALVDHARRIGEGDLTHRIALPGGDEISDLASEMNGMCSRLRDAQDRERAANEAKLKAMEQLRHADRLSTVGTLASGMAHELGTPLGIITGRAKMIAAPDTSEQDRMQYAQVITGQVERMSKIMRGLLNFARRTPAKKARADLRELTRRILDLLAPLAKKQEIELELKGDGGPLVAEVDAAQVEQAVANLVVNGVQATSRGGEVTADVRAVVATPPGSSKPGDYICIAIRDTGSGIPPEHLGRVFEPFFTTKDVGSGTGLGLSVTYGIVQEHGGFVDVASQVDHGTCFSLYFPA